MFSCCRKRENPIVNETLPINRKYSNAFEVFFEMIHNSIDKKDVSFYDSVKDKEIFTELINLSINEIDEIFYLIESNFKDDIDKISADMEYRALDTRMLYIYVVDVIHGYLRRRKTN